VLSARIGHIYYAYDEGEHANLQKQALLPGLHDLDPKISWSLSWLCSFWIAMRLTD
jgi:hypothetical protein